MERILIIGCGGSGKSTLARKLGQITSLPVIHLDQIYWSPGNWEHLSEEEFDERLLTELKKSCWIMDGNFNRTLALRYSYCDTVIWLDYSRITCVLGLLKRIVTNYGKTRPDMAPGCNERFDFEFLKWIWNFNKEKRPKYMQLLQQRKDVKVYILKNRRQAEKLLRTEFR